MYMAVATVLKKFKELGMPGIKELLVILVVVLIIFGAGRLKNIGKDLGVAIKNFKDGLSDQSDKKK